MQQQQKEDTSKGSPIYSSFVSLLGLGAALYGAYTKDILSATVGTLIYTAGLTSILHQRIKSEEYSLDKDIQGLRKRVEELEVALREKPEKSRELK